MEGDIVKRKRVAGGWAVEPYILPKGARSMQKEMSPRKERYAMCDDDNVMVCDKSGPKIVRGGD